MTARDGDIELKYSARLRKLRFVAVGSPTPRYMVYHLRDYLVGTYSSEPREYCAESDDPLPISNRQSGSKSSLKRYPWSYDSGRWYIIADAHMNKPGPPVKMNKISGIWVCVTDTVSGRDVATIAVLDEVNPGCIE